MAAVTEGDVGEQSLDNRNGTQFRLDEDEGVFAIFEAVYRLNQQKDAKGLRDLSPGDLELPTRPAHAPHSCQECTCAVGAVVAF